MKNQRLTVLIVCLIAFGSFLLNAAEIHTAARDGDLEKIKSLLAKDPGLANAADDSESTPLIIASYYGKEEVVKLLLKYKADVNAVSQWGSTPLSNAAVKGRVNIVKLLLQHKADAAFVNSKGDGAIDFAEAWGHTEVVEILEKKGAKPNPVKDADTKKFTKNLLRLTFDYSIRPNLAVFVGKDGFLTVDTGLRRTGGKLKETLTKLSGGKFDNYKYIINSHHHGDHNQGNFIAPNTTKIITGANLDDMVKQGILKKAAGSLKGKSGKTFDTYYTMNFNGEEIRIIPYPGCHSQNDVLVHFTKSRVVHMGDLLLSQSFPAVGRNVKAYMEFLDKAIDILPHDAVIVSGHGKDLDIEGLKHYRAMLRESIRIVKAAMAKGKSLDQMKKEKILKKYESYNTYLDWLNTDYFTGAVYRSYRPQTKPKTK